VSPGSLAGFGQRREGSFFPLYFTMPIDQKKKSLLFPVLDFENIGALVYHLGTKNT
jgi:hypothetical protein